MPDIFIFYQIYNFSMTVSDPIIKGNNARGGILDDLMVTNLGDRLFVVVNAACKAAASRLLPQTPWMVQPEPLPVRSH